MVGVYERGVWVCVCMGVCVCVCLCMCMGVCACGCSSRAIENPPCAPPPPSGMVTVVQSESRDVTRDVTILGGVGFVARGESVTVLRGVVVCCGVLRGVVGCCSAVTSVSDVGDVCGEGVTVLWGVVVCCSGL